jgi:hypothetical protein
MKGNSPSLAKLPGAKSVFDKSRGARVRWIEPLVNGRFEQSECWEVSQAGKPESRLYVLWPERYMVWLYPMTRELGWNFSTGYIAANHNYIRGKTRGVAKKIWWHTKCP